MTIELSEKSERGLAVIGEMRGQQFSDLMRSAAASKKFGSAITRMALDFSFADSWGRDGLARRDRSLVVIGVLIAQRQSLELKNHIKIGIANGLTVREIEEILVQATSYVGFPCIATAMTAAIEAFREIDMAPNVDTAEERGLL